jgi:hypothetical protein
MEVQDFELKLGAVAFGCDNNSGLLLDLMKVFYLNYLKGDSWNLCGTWWKRFWFRSKWNSYSNKWLQYFSGKFIIKIKENYFGGSVGVFSRYNGDYPLEHGKDFTWRLEKDYHGRPNVIY